MNRTKISDTYYWIVECFMANDKRFAVNAYELAKVNDVIEIVNDTLGKEISGITEIEISFVEKTTPVLEELGGNLARIVPTCKLIRFKRFSSKDDAMNTLKLWSLFS
jgi:hypothetical protein